MSKKVIKKIGTYNGFDVAIACIPKDKELTLKDIENLIGKENLKKASGIPKEAKKNE